MLGKLFKYEFKYTYKLMLVIYLVVAGLTALGAVTFKTEAVKYIGNDLVQGIIVIAYFIAYLLSLFALLIVTYVFMCKRFYDTTYSARGYLTHTLPVRRSSIFHVKLFVSFIWMLLSVAVFVLSMYSFMKAMGGIEDISELMQDVYREVFGIYGVELGVILVMSTCISCLYFLLLVFTGMSIGQLFENRVGASIVAVIAIYFAKSIISQIMSFALAISAIVSAEGEPVTSSRIQYYVPMAFDILVLIALYITSRVILEKKLNLE